MFFVNPLTYLFQLNFIPWIFGAFALFGVILCLKKVFGRGV